MIINNNIKNNTITIRLPYQYHILETLIDVVFFFSFLLEKSNGFIYKILKNS